MDSISANAKEAYSVSQIQAVTNQILENTFSGVTIIGEVSEFKVNQKKFVFFNLKDEEASISCFMTVWQLHFPIEDGMKVIIRATPKLTAWGRLSFTVHTLQPAGEGSLKKSFELLKKKLAAEGLFNPDKKRPLPTRIQKIGVISSTQAAGYADFCKIINERWGGLEIITAHVQVQGLVAPEQIIRALKYFNEHNNVDVIAIIRGGGSADDLAAFNDEELVRTIAASKIPTITGIGHEVDESLSDLAADYAASTPSNVAQILTPDKRIIKQQLQQQISQTYEFSINRINFFSDFTKQQIKESGNVITQRINLLTQKILHYSQLLTHINPENILKQGYALIRGDINIDSTVDIVTHHKIAQAKIIKIKERDNS
ncbi:exodeoxyribonuclease VII large subunit [Candidatus Saccharibacteria bacterium]|nr:exodeoxyribonuclease VII large subunit [Candidatus Saccharibacteria bacterium]